MKMPELWSKEMWARAAAPAMPQVHVGRYLITSDATPHHARYMGGTHQWTVDWLPGRTLTEEQARAAMFIAVAPDRGSDVQQWAGKLDLTVGEALGYLRFSDGDLARESGVEL